MDSSATRPTLAGPWSFVIGPWWRSVRPLVQWENGRSIIARWGFDSLRADSVIANGTEVLRAAHPALNRRGVGSNPTGPISLTIRRRLDRAHEVAAAYRPATAEARVQIPLGTSVVLMVRGVGKPGHSACFGSRRASVRIRPPRWYCFAPFRWNSCWYECPAVNRDAAGSIPAAGAGTVGRASRMVTAPDSNSDER